MFGPRRAVVGPLHLRVGLVGAARGGQGCVAIAELDRHRHPDRAAQAADRMLAKIRMLVAPRRHLRMCQLHQQGASATQQQDVLAVDPPRDRVLFEKTWPQAARASSELTWS